MSALRDVEKLSDFRRTVGPRALMSRMIEGPNCTEIPYDPALWGSHAETLSGSNSAVIATSGGTTVPHGWLIDLETGRAGGLGGTAIMACWLNSGPGAVATGIAGSRFERGSASAWSGATSLIHIVDARQLGAWAEQGEEFHSFPTTVVVPVEVSTAASGRGVAEAQKGPPKGDHIGQLLDKYALLEDDWLDERSKAPGKGTVDRARSLYLSSREGRYPPKRCYVSGDGEVGLVWEKGKGYANVGFWADGSVVYYVRSVDGTKEIRDDVSLGDQESLPIELIKALRAFYA